MKRQERIKQLILTIIMSCIALTFLIPMVSIVSASISDEQRLTWEGYGILPRGFSLDGYKFVFQDPIPILRAYGVTFAFSTIGTFGTVLTSALVAYPLSKRDFPGRKQISFYLYFTMLFSGGAMPSYILNAKYLHMADTFWIYIIPGLVGAWSIFMMRAYFQGLPRELSEAAYIDGAGEYTIFSKIVIPLSTPVIATMAFTTFLSKWNNWNTSMVYIKRNHDLISLQYFLRRMVINGDIMKNAPTHMVSANTFPRLTTQMAMTLVVAGPAMFIFPFFQKYFAKGLVVGSVKG